MILSPVLLISVSMSIKASDHGDTAENFNRIGADLTDVFIFPSPENDDNVVLVMDVHGLIPAGQSASFDPGVLYQFKIDTTGDNVEDLVIQAKFFGTGASQQVGDRRSDEAAHNGHHCDLRPARSGSGDDQPGISARSDRAPRYEGFRRTAGRSVFLRRRTALHDFPRPDDSAHGQGRRTFPIPMLRTPAAFAHRDRHRTFSPI